MKKLSFRTPRLFSPPAWAALGLSLSLLLASSARALPVEPGAQAQDQAALTAGLNHFEENEETMSLVLYEDKAFPVVTQIETHHHSIPAAASGMGNGRVLALGAACLDAYPMPPNQARLIKNALQWLNSGRPPQIGLLPSFKNATAAANASANLQQLGHSTRMLSSPLSPSALANLNTLILDPGSLQTAEEIGVVREFVRNGGALIAFSNIGAWLDASGKQSIRNEFPGNQLLQEAGIAWSGRSTSGSVSLQTPPPVANALQALTLMLAGNAGAPYYAESNLRLAIRSVAPANNPFFQLLGQARARFADTMPSPSQPLSLDTDRWQLFMFSYLAAEDVNQVKAHPAANIFPGAVPASAPRVTRQLRLFKTPKASAENWLSTGLYAAPGEKITITLPPGSAAQNLSAIIGAHTDDLNYAEERNLRRAPNISRTFALQDKTTIANAFGGLIYIQGVSNLAGAPLEVKIEGAVEAPRFVAGVSSVDEWRNTLRQLPGPWAELENGEVIITLQSSAIRNLDDPRPMLAALARGISRSSQLAAWEAGEKKPMRMVFDEQIAAGYMHAGYPVMAWLSSQDWMVNFNADHASSGDVWGYFHEFGHNHQNPAWVFEGTGEVSVNLFTLAALEKIYGRPKEEIGSDFSHANQQRAMAKYFKAGANFKTLNKDPFLTLLPFLQLVDAFGWDALTALFKEYRALPANQLPSGDAAILDQFVQRYSRKVGRNLAPFFSKWGFRVQATTEQALSSLPGWLPSADFPQNHVQFNETQIEITGRIKLGNQEGLRVAASVLHNGQSCGTADVANGEFKCYVPRNWSGKISFQRGGYRFQPAEIAVSADTQNIDLGTVIAGRSSQPGLTIQGRITDDKGNGIADVFPLATGADCRASDEQGHYTCVVDAGWNGELRMQRPTYTFSPAVRSFQAVGNAVQGADFVAATDAIWRVPACTLSAQALTPGTVLQAGSKLQLKASCTPAAESYIWSEALFPANADGGQIQPQHSARYSVTGVNAAGAGLPATVAVSLCGSAPLQAEVGEVVYGLNGAHRFSGTSGNDVFLGRAGIDTVHYPCPRSFYHLEKTEHGLKVSSNAEGVDELHGIEKIRFADRMLRVDTEGNAGQAYRIYQAAFKRSPDQTGLGYWIGRMDEGVPLQEVAKGFLASKEFETSYGKNLSNGDFVLRLYDNVLQRAADASGFVFWVDLLNRGQIDRSRALLEFSESNENKAGTGPRLEQGIELTPAN